MDRPQFNEANKSNNMLTTFPSSPCVESTFIQAARHAAQRQSKKYQRDANEGKNFVTQEDSHQSQRVRFNESLINAHKFETEYKDFAPSKCAKEAVFIKVW